MFAKLVHRYHRLGEKLVALHYTGWTWLAIHEDEEADLARVATNFSCKWQHASAHAYAHAQMPKFQHQISSCFCNFFQIFIMLFADFHNTFF